MIRLLRTRFDDRPVSPARRWQIFCRPSRVVCSMTLLAVLSLLGMPSMSHAQTALSPGAPPGVPTPAPPTVVPTPALAAVPAPPPTTTAPPGPNAPADDKNQKIVTNPFTPGGVTSNGQIVSRDELDKLLAAQETRLKKELGGGVTQEEISKLVANAAGGTVVRNPDNFIGCVNGVPIYRLDDGTLNLGTREAEEVKLIRCAK